MQSSPNTLFVPLLTLFVRRAILVFGVAGVLGFAVFKALYNAFSKPRAEEMSAEPKQKAKRPVKFSELLAATGGPGEDLFIAVKDPHSSEITVFDVSSGLDFYGPGGPYHVFAGQNASYGLARSSTDPGQIQGDLSTLTESEKDTHLGWYTKYASKYPIVGFLVPNDYVPPDPQPGDANAEEKKDA